MEWYWFVLILWPICGFVALVMDIRDNPRMQENIGLAEIWPAVFGPLWLAVKCVQLIAKSRSA